MKFLSLPKIGQHIAEKKEVTIEDPAFVNAKKVIRVLDAVEDWDSIKGLVVDDAPFSCQADAIAEVKTVKDWYDWMVNFKNNIAPDASFTVKSTAWDAERKIACHAATFHATHTGSGGPCETTNRHADTDYFYQVQMNDEGKVVSMLKIWNDGHCLKQLGWA